MSDTVFVLIVIGVVAAIAAAVYVRHRRRLTAQLCAVLESLRSTHPGWFVDQSSLAGDFGLDALTRLDRLAACGIIERRPFKLRLADPVEVIVDSSGSQVCFETVGYRPPMGRETSLDASLGHLHV